MIVLYLTIVIVVMINKTTNQSLDRQYFDIVVIDRIFDILMIKGSEKMNEKNMIYGQMYNICGRCIVAM